MANPKLPEIPDAERELLYGKLNEYNRGRSSYKEAGAYLIVLPRGGHDNYSLWVFAPQLEKQSILFLHELSTDINEALRTASTLFYFSKRCLLVMEYNEKRMTGNREDIIPFGKYRGHYLHEILKIDPPYLNWIAYKYTPKIPKQARFVEIAKVYHTVHLDSMLRKTRQQQVPSRFLGAEGELLKELTLKVIKVRFEDDPYKTKTGGNGVYFFVRQIVTLIDSSGNLAVLRFVSKIPSGESCRLPAMEHEYLKDELIHIASARVARTYEVYNTKYTRLSHVKLQPINA